MTETCVKLCFNWIQSTKITPTCLYDFIHWINEKRQHRCVHINCVDYITIDYGTLYKKHLHNSPTSLVIFNGNTSRSALLLYYIFNHILTKGCRLILEQGFGLMKVWHVTHCVSSTVSKDSFSSRPLLHGCFLSFH